MRVFVCSPYRGDVEANLAYARRACSYVLEKGHAPFAPHLIYPTVLDDAWPASRALGMAAGFKFLEACDEVWAFRDRGLSQGMDQELQAAEALGKPVREIFLDDESSES